jgi:PucR C-terminal helix-turn-helix domain/GGDEF-like domain
MSAEERSMASLEGVRAVVDRLRERNAEIVRAIYDRIREAVPDSTGAHEPTYQAGVLPTVSAVVAYSLQVIERGSGWSGPIPAEALAQTRRAARAGVSLGAVLRRYVAGHRRLGEFVTEETKRVGFSGDTSVLDQMRSTQEALLDSLLVAIDDEYAREIRRASCSPEQRLAEHVRQLLAGGFVDPTKLGYDLDSWHVCVVGTGMGVGDAVRAAVARVDCELLCVEHDQASLWAWLGGQRKAITGAIEDLMSTHWPAAVALAIGEAREGTGGWRLTHQEAQAALLVARPQQLTRCADVVLEAAMLRDETLARTLKDVYLSPLDDLRIGGHVARETLRAYFASGRNANVAAGSLGVDRRTVWHRLAKIATRLGWSPEERRAELEVALRIEALAQTLTQPVRAGLRS